MRTALNLPRPARRTKKKKVPHLQCSEALRACELAAARVKCASDDLAARWVELARELSDGAEPTDLLRTRAWCNVLELRLKERAAALEDARHLLDDAWQHIMAHPATALPATELRDPDIPCEPTDAHWPFLAQATNGFAAAARLSRTLK